MEISLQDSKSLFPSFAKKVCRTNRPKTNEITILIGPKIRPKATNDCASLTCISLEKKYKIVASNKTILFKLGPHSYWTIILLQKAGAVRTLFSIETKTVVFAYSFFNSRHVCSDAFHNFILFLFSDNFVLRLIYLEASPFCCNLLISVVVAIVLCEIKKK